MRSTASTELGWELQKAWRIFSSILWEGSGAFFERRWGGGGREGLGIAADGCGMPDKGRAAWLVLLSRLGRAKAGMEEGGMDGAGAWMFSCRW